MDGPQLAQVNVGRLRAPMDSPLIAAFAAVLDPINALAEASPGFVWRFQTEDGNATAVRPFDDDLVLINLSVWESVEALEGFVFRSDHAAFMKRRREWFDRMAAAYVALWWVPAGHRPSVDEAVGRLDHLRAHGPSEVAFTFRTAHPAPVDPVDSEARE